MTFSPHSSWSALDYKTQHSLYNRAWHGSMMNIFQCMPIYWIWILYRNKESLIKRQKYSYEVLAFWSSTKKSLYKLCHSCTWPVHMSLVQSRVKACEPKYKIIVPPFDMHHRQGHVFKVKRKDQNAKYNVFLWECFMNVPVCTTR